MKGRSVWLRERSNSNRLSGDRCVMTCHRPSVFTGEMHLQVQTAATAYRDSIISRLKRLKRVSNGPIKRCLLTLRLLRWLTINASAYLQTTPFALLPSQIYRTGNVGVRASNLSLDQFLCYLTMYVDVHIVKGKFYGGRVKLRYFTLPYPRASWRGIK